MNTKDISINPEDQPSTEQSQKDNSLENCSPTSGLQPHYPQTAENKIRRSRRDEPFTTVGDPKHIACLVDKNRDDWGNQTGEDYYPVIGDLQSQVGSSIRSIAFHPCVTATGETFIYPQKIDPPDIWANSWNASLAKALSLPDRQWRTVASDKAAQCYQYEQVNSPMSDTPRYLTFEDDLNQALTPNIVSKLDHPVVQKTLSEQQSDSDGEGVY
jgi:hypothetical protein